MDCAGERSGPQLDHSLKTRRLLVASRMPALTVSQPFASLIADGAKWVENRRWATNYRGALAIHAGRGTQYLSATALTLYPTGAVIAVCDLVGCVPFDRERLLTSGSKVLDSLGITVADFLRHVHTEGPYCWILRDVRKLAAPCDCVGKQGLWKWDCPRFLEVIDG